MNLSAVLDILDVVALGVCVAMPLLVLAQDPRARANRIFALYLGSLALLIGAHFGLQTASFGRLRVSVAGDGVAAGFVLNSLALLAFLAEHTGVRRRAWVRRGLAAAAGLAVVLVLLAFQAGGLLPWLQAALGL